MNCKFCNQKCEDAVITKSYGYLRCNPCKAEFRDHNNVINIFFTYKNKEYFYQERDRVGAEARFLSSVPSIEILNFSIKPSGITPSNVIEKFKLFMLLS